MLSNLQVLRGFAALGVVFFHTDYRLAGDWHTEFFGVATFFVISGFIMGFITRDNADDFLAKRLVRIAPLYWLCTVVLLVVMFRLGLFESGLWTQPLDDRPGEPLWSYVGRGLLFLPLGDKYPILNVGWSLHFEMYFYLLFAAALWISRRAAPLIVAASLLALGVAEGTVCTAAVCHYLSMDYLRFFIAGIAIFYGLQHLTPRSPRRWLVACGAVVVAACYGSQFVGPWWSNAVTPEAYLFLAAAAPIAIVASALVVEYAGGAVTWRPLIVIGNASYAIYLIHPILFELMRMANARWLQWPAPKDSLAMMLLYVAAAGVVGVLVHLHVENPLLRAMRRGNGPVVRVSPASPA